MSVVGDRRGRTSSKLQENASKSSIKRNPRDRSVRVREDIKDCLTEVADERGKKGVQKSQIFR